MKKIYYLLLITLSIVSILSVSLFYKKIFSSIPFSLKINRKEAIDIASKFLKKEGYDIKGYKKVINFYEWRQVSFFLQKIGKLKKAKEIFGNKFPLWYWCVRFFKPEKKEEFRVSINCESGAVTLFRHIISQEKKIKSVSGDEAKRIAFHYLENKDIYFSKFPNIDYYSERQPYRTDQYITLTSIPSDFKGAKLGFTVGIFGNKVGTYYATVSIPDSFNREFLYQNSFTQLLAIISFAILVVLLVITLVYLILFIKRGNPIKWKNSLISAGIITFLSLLSIINFLPAIWFKYNTAIPLKIYSTIIGVIWSLVGIFMFGCFALIFGVGERFANITWDKSLISFLNGSSYFKTKEFGKKVLIGYCWGAILIGFIFWFYFICQKFGNIWIFMTPTLFGSLPSLLSFLLPITIGITSAFGEEFIFRAISISLFKKWFRYSLIAIILSAFIWGLGHATFEIYPVYFRIIGITIVGIILGTLFLKFGIETTISTHFFINSFALSYFLINLDLPYLRFSGIIAIIITLLPLLLFSLKILWLPYFSFRKNSK